jgi:colanic acid biosynthesis glycosyl transferase WcaI
VRKHYGAAVLQRSEARESRAEHRSAIARTPRLVFATELYRPELHGTGHYLTALAEALATDRPIAVVTAQPTYTQRGTRAPRSEAIGGVAVHRCRATTFDRSRMVARAANIVTFCASAAWKLARVLHRGDVVVVVTNPPFLPLIALAAARLRRARSVVVVHDLYPDAAIAAGMVRPGTTVARIWSRITATALRRADRVVAVGRDQAERIRAVPGVDSDSVAVIPNWADLDVVWPDDRARQTFRESVGVEENDVLAVFAGNHGRLQDLETLLDAAEKLVGDGRITMAFIGDGVRRRWVEDEVVRRSLTNVRLLAHRDRADQREFLCGADVVLVPLVAGMRGVSVPSRVYNALAAGTPVLAITEPGSEVDRLIAEADVGWVSAPGDVAAVVDALRGLVRGDDRAAGRARCAVFASERLGIEPALRDYRRIVDDLVAACR